MTPTPVRPPGQAKLLGGSSQTGCSKRSCRLLAGGWLVAKLSPSRSRLRHGHDMYWHSCMHWHKQLIYSGSTLVTMQKAARCPACTLTLACNAVAKATDHLTRFTLCCWGAKEAATSDCRNLIGSETFQHRLQPAEHFCRCNAQHFELFKCMPFLPSRLSANTSEENLESRTLASPAVHF